MPELPEVENILKGIVSHIKGRKIEDFKSFHPRFSLLSKVIGSTIEDVFRYGKYLVWKLNQGKDLIFQFRMTGKLLWKDKFKVDKYDLCAFFMGGRWLFFSSIRKFATVELGNFSEYRKRLGPDAIGEDFSLPYFEAKLCGSRVPIKNFLLKQDKIAGLGNIYVCEALFLSRIDPRRESNTLNKKEIATLYKNIKDILQFSIEKGGTSFRDYRKPDGSKGEFQNYLLVFQRYGHPCPECKSPIQRIKQSGRSTYFCPQCQK